MKELFHALYQGYIQSEEFPFDRCDEETSKLLFSTFQDFFLSLPENKKATFRDWESLNKQLHEKELAFIEGIKCGVRFILDATKNE